MNLMDADASYVLLDDSYFKMIEFSSMFQQLLTLGKRFSAATSIWTFSSVYTQMCLVIGCLIECFAAMGAGKWTFASVDSV